MKKKAFRFFAVVCAAVLSIGFSAAYDLSSAEDYSDIQFKRELLYTLSKADDLQRQFQAGTLSEPVMARILTDSNLLFVLQNELRYNDLWLAVVDAMTVDTADTETVEEADVE